MTGTATSASHGAPPPSAWHAAWLVYRPISEAWKIVGEEADTLETGTPEHDEAIDRWRTNIRAYAAAREIFMAVPAPTLGALAVKMRAADACDDEHHDNCLADLERLIAGGDSDREIDRKWELLKPDYQLMATEYKHPVAKMDAAYNHAAELETAIVNTVATSVRAAEIQAWIALHHLPYSEPHFDPEKAGEDFATIDAMDRKLDFLPRAVLAVIRSLRLMGATA